MEKGAGLGGSGVRELQVPPGLRRPRGWVGAHVWLPRVGPRLKAGLPVTPVHSGPAAPEAAVCGLTSDPAARRLLRGGSLPRRGWVSWAGRCGGGLEWSGHRPHI